MTTVSDEATQTSADLCQACIAALIGSQAGITGALVSTVDGFAVAAQVRPPVSGDRLAAMTSSLVALVDAVSQDGGIGEGRDIVVDATAGRLLLLDVPQAGSKLILTVLCDPSATPGQVLWAARRCREHLSARLPAPGVQELVHER